jgi:hypothetical protein
MNANWLHRTFAGECPLIEGLRPAVEGSGCFCRRQYRRDVGGLMCIHCVSPVMIVGDKQYIQQESAAR